MNEPDKLQKNNGWGAHIQGDRPRLPDHAQINNKIGWVKKQLATLIEILKTDPPPKKIIGGWVREELQFIFDNIKQGNHNEY